MASGKNKGTYNLYIDGKAVSVSSNTYTTSYSQPGTHKAYVTASGEKNTSASITTIGARAFYHCKDLKSITIPASVKSIESSAFYNCSSLENVTFCRKNTIVKESAFSNCSDIQNVYYVGQYDDRFDMVIDDYNDDLINATWNYGYVVPDKANVSSISIKSNPAKTTYTEGETLNTSGLKLAVKYSDGSTKEVTSGFTCTPTTLLTVGTQKITVTFGGKTATFNVTVKADEKKLNDAKSQAISELNTAKNNAISDEAKTILDNAINAVNSASSVSDVTLKKNEAVSSADKADKALADAKSKAISELESEKKNANTDAEKKAIDEKINSIKNATNLNDVNAASKSFDKVNIKVAGEKTIDYRSIVTITAKADNVPNGYKLAIYFGNDKKAEGDNKSVSYEYGEIKSDINYTVKVIDANGKVQKDSNENELSKDGGKITCNAGFFKKLIAFFKGLFGSLPKVEVKP